MPTIIPRTTRHSQLRDVATPHGAAGISYTGRLIQADAALLTSNAATTSGSYADLLSVSMTTGANNLMLFGFVSFSQATNLAQPTFVLDIDTVVVAASRDNVAANTQASCIVMYYGSVSAAAHTIKLKWKTTAATTQTRPNTHVEEEGAALHVMEIE